MSAGTLAVDTGSMRGAAAGLAGVAIEFHGEKAGLAVTAGASGMDGLATSSACLDVGGALRGEARALGDDVQGYADKLAAAAERYERSDYEAAESIDFAGPADSPR